MFLIKPEQYHKILTLINKKVEGDYWDYKQEWHSENERLLLDILCFANTVHSESKSRNSMRPHMRRGHWHHYWVGSRDNDEERKLILKWVAPIMINVLDVEEDLPVVKTDLTI